MRSKPVRTFRGIAAPVTPGLPAVVRLCSAFVDSLPTLLKVAFIVAAFAFAKDIRDLVAPSVSPVVEVEARPAAPAKSIVPKDVAKPDEPVLNERVVHYLNCTHEQYRNEHYDACVDEPSMIYARPAANPDDSSFIPRDRSFRVARMPSQAVAGDEA